MNVYMTSDITNLSILAYIVVFLDSRADGSIVKFISDSRKKYQPIGWFIEKKPHKNDECIYDE